MLGNFLNLFFQIGFVPRIEAIQAAWYVPLAERYEVAMVKRTRKGVHCDYGINPIGWFIVKLCTYKILAF